MKPINFVKTISPKQQIELQRWIKITTLVFVLGVGAAVYVVAPHAMRLQELYQEKKELVERAYSASSGSLQEYERIKVEMAGLKKRQETLTKREQHPRLMIDQLKTVLNLVGKEMSLQNIKCDHKDMMLRLNCGTADAALAAIEKLEKSRFLTHVRLAALQQTKGALPLQMTVHAQCI